MYESFYGLKRKPFGLHPDPEYLYMSEVHERVYSHLLYAISENKGFAVITGEIGSGKTTLINYILEKIKQRVHVGLINRTDVSPTQLLTLICQEFELDVQGLDKAGLQEILDDFLLSEFASRKRVILIIDEAQNLPEKTIEEIRMLSNLESERHRLIQIILVGQPGLRKKLRRKELEQFAQRVTVYCHLAELNKKDAAEYIRYRLKVAGAENREIFDPKAIGEIYSYSRGIPRLINIMCDTALVYGYADEKPVIDGDIIRSVIRAREDAVGVRNPGEEKREDTQVPEAVWEKIRILEGRVAALENQLVYVGQRLNALGEMRNRHDEIVVELFKMLKGALEARKAMALKLHALQSRLRKKAKTELLEVSSPRVSSFPGLKNRRKG